MSIIPYDLGNILVVENCLKIKVNHLVSKTQKDLKLSLLSFDIEVLGVKINLTTSKTQFHGKRIWFSCPQCERRVGILFKHPIEEIIGCRGCLNLQYRQQRYKGMIESFI